MNWLQKVYIRFYKNIIFLNSKKFWVKNWWFDLYCLNLNIDFVWVLQALNIDNKIIAMSVSKESA